MDFSTKKCAKHPIHQKRIFFWNFMIINYTTAYDMEYGNRNEIYYDLREKNSLRNKKCHAGKS
ncbi:hypothetical protein NECAME_09189 [Necator americanus]|uniref:Uncharacterized protein n=1 Tax=Necator americanus TaxID=51031 RepID=W2TFU2_NECAM|nr:hypothetical protein NECAME_09189 [Necator americanus]ETN80459.1 hypothetical protein NECAME_09189 [Necator americanus]